MKIALILSPENKGWILEKFARRMMVNLVDLGHQVQLTEDVVPGVDITHFLSYNFVDSAPGYRTAFVTHIDDSFKISHLKKLLKNELIDKFICMSQSTVEHLVKNGLPRDSLSYVLPAVDACPPPRLIKIGLSGRIYKDGRKNEDWLSDAASRMSLENFEFHIFGSGWDDIANELVSSKASVYTYGESLDYTHDHHVILEKLKILDYWMYLGFDEGSMGSLDAALAGVSLIATPQGFHLDLDFNRNLWVNSAQELFESMIALSNEKPSTSDLEYWTWLRYSQDHLAIWNKGEPVRQINNVPNLNLAPDAMLRKIGWRRILSYLGRTTIGLNLRRKFRG